MATRSRLGLQLSDGSILSVYHHWDGYPQWLGKTLVEHYNTQELVSELVDGGDMSCCYSDEIFGKKLPEGTFAPEYYSARGEDCPPRLDKDLFEYLSNGEEYAYVWEEGFWTCYDLHQFGDEAPEVVEIPQVQ